MCTHINCTDEIKFLTKNVGKFLILHTQGGHLYHTHPGVMCLSQNVHKNLETSVSCLIQDAHGF